MPRIFSEEMPPLNEECAEPQSPEPAPPPWSERTSPFLPLPDVM